MLDLLTLAVFLFVLSLVWLLAGRMLRPRAAPAGLFPPGGAMGQPAAAEDPLTRALVEGLAAQVPQGLSGGQEVDKDLRRAGYYRPGARQRLFALRNGLAILALVATGIVAVALGPQHRVAVVWTLWIGGLVAIVLWSLPRVVLAIQGRRRVRRIGAAIPDALDTISMCLQGGISLQDSLAHVGREMVSVHRDLGIELLMVAQHSEINSFEYAIQQFAARIDAAEVVALAAIVTQNQRLGTGIVESIREFADNLRLKRRQLAEAKASLAELFLLFPVVFCLVPSVLLILWGPAILTLVEHLRTALPIRMIR